MLETIIKTRAAHKVGYLSRGGLVGARWAVWGRPTPPWVCDVSVVAPAVLASPSKTSDVDRTGVGTDGRLLLPFLARYCSFFSPSVESKLGLPPRLPRVQIGAIHRGHGRK